MNRLVGLFFIGIFIVFSSDAVAQLQGRMTTSDGKSYEVVGFGVNSKPKDYYVKTDQGFVSLANVQQVSRVGSGLAGNTFYYILTFDGQLLRGEIGLLFFNRATYYDANSGAERSGFEAVLKGRGSDGLLFSSVDSISQEIYQHELYNPNDVVELVLWSGDPQSIDAFVASRTSK